jgi:hypothetical protein
LLNVLNTGDLLTSKERRNAEAHLEEEERQAKLRENLWAWESLVTEVAGTALLA